MGVCPVFISVHNVCVCWLWRSEEGVGSSGTGVTSGCKEPCRCWKLSPGPLEEQPGLLTTGHLSSPSGHVSNDAKSTMLGTENYIETGKTKPKPTKPIVTKTRSYHGEASGSIRQIL